MTFKQRKGKDAGDLTQHLNERFIYSFRVIRFNERWISSKETFQKIAGNSNDDKR